MIAHDEDTLTSILIRLPPKPLIRFKLVSKQWCSLISSDYFSQLHALHHRRRRRQPSLLLRLSGENSVHHYLHLNPLTQKLVPYHFPPNLTQPTISSSSNGLLMLQIRIQEEELHYIYNPTSRNSRKIELRSHERFRSVLGLSLAFDPSVSFHYKIICVRSTRRSSRSFLCHWWRFCVIEIYDSETGDWSLIGEPIWAPIDVGFNRGVYLNGFVHWSRMFFDVNEGVVMEHPKIEFPEGSMTRSRSEKFSDDYVELRGCLHYVCHFPGRNSVMVFQLENDFSQWSMKYKVAVDGVSVSLIGLVSRTKEEEDEEDSAVVLHEAGKFMVYGFKEGKCRDIVDIRGQPFYEEGSPPSVSNCSFQFVETLARV